MPELDWAVWPIYALQALAIVFLLLPPRVLGLSTRWIVIFILISVCIAMVLSLNHDSTSALHLHF
jgi:hypothetical protein